MVAFAAGSGITPVLSLMKEALHRTTRGVRLLYANRDADSVIFAAELDRLMEEFPDRLAVTHHLDVDAGLLDAEGVRAHLGTASASAGHYLCGPTPFMDIVEGALGAVGVAADRIHVERFVPADDAPADDVGAAAGAPCRVTIELDGRTEVTDHHPGTTILQTARQAGLAPPSSCESGNCATCMARLLEGTVEMRANNALEDDEVEQGWILTCQSVPTSDTVSVVYGF
jgi:3-ketosteroid 9alpha-monooxygenase subunit B